jgi:hypothetical protein
MKFIVLDTRRSEGLNLKLRSHFGFKVVSSFLNRGRASWSGGLSLFQQQNSFYQPKAIGFERRFLVKFLFTSVPERVGAQVQ